MTEVLDSSALGKKPFILPGEFDTTGSIIRAGLSALSSDPVLAVDPSANFDVHLTLTTSSSGEDWASWFDQLWRTYSALMAIQVENVHPKIERILTSIDELMQEEDVEDYTFKPTPHAYQHARTLIRQVFDSLEASVRDQLPEPRVFSDGTGGIVVQWNYQGRTLNTGFPPEDNQHNYLYYELGEEYKLIDFSLEALKERLNWLIHE